jgi:hypothetical protein
LRFQGLGKNIENNNVLQKKVEGIPQQKLEQNMVFSEEIKENN